jgi:hypothetical protein
VEESELNAVFAFLSLNNNNGQDHSYNGEIMKACRSELQKCMDWDLKNSFAHNIFYKDGDW